MLIEVKVPKLQKKDDEIIEGMSCPIDPEVRRLQSLVTLAEWYVKDFEPVEKDAALCFLESSKAAMEIPAEKNGYVKILKGEGAQLSPGEALCLLADSVDELHTGGLESPRAEATVDVEKGGPAGVDRKASFWAGLRQWLKAVFGRGES